MLKAGVIIDTFKREVFERRLKEAGYTWENERGLTPDTISLQVYTNSILELEKVIQAAQKECREKFGFRG